MLKKRFFPEGVILLLLLAMLVLDVAAAIANTGWMPGLENQWWIGLGALVISFLIARSLLPDGLAYLFALIIGSGWSYWQVSRMLPAGLSDSQRWWEVIIRLGRWLTAMTQGGGKADNLIFALQISLFLWLISFLAVWWLLRKKQAWLSVIPGGIMLVVSAPNAPRNIDIFFWAYILLALCLVTRYFIYQNSESWRSEHILISSQSSRALAGSGFLISFLLIALTWLLPPLNMIETPAFLQPAERVWQDSLQTWNRVYADINYRAYPSPAVATGFSNTLGLSGQRRPSDKPVVEVLSPLPRYWRAITYDRYTGRYWESTASLLRPLAANDKSMDLLMPRYAGREVITQTFTPEVWGMRTLLAAGEALSFDRETQITTRGVWLTAADAGTELPWAKTDIELLEGMLGVQSHLTLHSGENYAVVSAVSDATVEMLRQAGENYPQFIRRQYLQLPAGISGRVIDLAARLTGASDNPFDKATAIEQYLRQSITYTESPPALPQGKEPTDFLLFESPHGYCNQYASAMVVLLRLSGIPARLASGYATGELMPDGRYMVREKDAHTWVEAYFPAYGWIEFEPTSARPQLIRRAAVSGFTPGALPTRTSGPSATPVNPLEEIQRTRLRGRGSQPLNPPAFVIAALSGGRPWLFLLLAVAAGAGITLIWRRWFMPPPANESAPARLFRRLVVLGRLLGLRRRPDTTPNEYTTALSRYLPASQNEFKTICQGHVQYLYGRHLPGEENSWPEKAISAWLALRSRLPRDIGIFLRRKYLHLSRRHTPNV